MNIFMILNVNEFSAYIYIYIYISLTFYRLWGNILDIKMSVFL
jgi:hypothetical protein